MVAGEDQKDIADFISENVKSHQDLEVEWAIRAMQQAEGYFESLLSAADCRKLVLTEHDDELYSDFKTTFPHIDVAHIALSDFKSPEAKATWREFILRFKPLLHDFDLGTLLRYDASGEYNEENTFLVARVQFYAVEVARNREGVNAKVVETQKKSSGSVE